MTTLGDELWSQVLWCATQGVCLLVCCKLLGKAKVSQLEVAVYAKQQIFWLQIPANHTLCPETLTDHEIRVDSASTPLPGRCHQSHPILSHSAEQSVTMLGVSLKRMTMCKRENGDDDGVEAAVRAAAAGYATLTRA